MFTTHYWAHLLNVVNKNKMKNMNTTLEIPEGSKATIAGKNIDGVADAVNDSISRIYDGSNMG